MPKDNAYLLFNKQIQANIDIFEDKNQRGKFNLY